MKVQRLVLEPFIDYAKLDVRFPDRGVLVVCGPNGTGKSTLVEAVGWGLYGKMIRPLAPPKPARVAVTVDARGETTTVERHHPAKGPATVRVSHGWIEFGSASGEVQGVTATKTQHQVDAEVGPWERHVATRVFDRHLVARFGSATDSTRKALLEELLGLGRFDAALKVARDQAHEVQGRCAGLARDLDRVRGVLEGLEASRVQGAGPRPPDPADLDVAAAAAGAAADVAERAADEWGRRVNELAASSRQASRDAGQAKAAAEASERALREMAQPGACPTCGRPWDAAPAEKVARARADADAARLAAEVAEAEGADADAALREAREAFDREYANLTTAREAEREARLAAKGARAAMQAWEAADRDAREHAGKLEEARAEEARIVDELYAAEMEAGVLVQAQAVFGLQGARNMMLGRTLGRLEAASNYVLDRLCGERAMRLSIGGRKELKKGGKVDKISLRVEGAAAPEYGGLSGGQRVRVDVSLLLALASITPADQDGTLFFDEVFDSVDDEGKDHVASLLHEMAEERLVVVITHSEALVSRFPRTAVWRVPEPGKLEVAA